MKRVGFHLFVASSLVAACADARDYELAGVIQLNKGESFSITPRTPLVDDKPFKDLCLLPMNPESLAKAEEFGFKAEDGQSFLPVVTAVNEQGQVIPLNSPSLRVAAGGEAWVCLSPILGATRGPFVQVRIATPYKLRLASVHWHNFEK